MIEGQHYGIVPGCGNKPTLLKAGAEKLGFIFKLAPSFVVTQKDFNETHREYQILCTLNHIETGKLIAQGVGSASTMESKYRYRKDWQTKTRIENPDIADQYNTVLKMAKKRAFVDATITATAASDIFTQDIEDIAPMAQPVIIKPLPNIEIQKIFDELKMLVKSKQIETSDIINEIKSLTGKEIPFLELPIETAREIREIFTANKLEEIV